jgi:hypothetical protein
MGQRFAQSHPRSRAGGDSLQLLAATHERWLYLALLVRDNKVLYDASMLAPLDSATIGDRIWLAFDDRRGGQSQLFFSSTGAGKLVARRIETREYGREEAVEEPRIERYGNDRATVTCSSSESR